MRKPNGYGSIKKLSGTRRRPYAFVVSTEGKQKPIAYFSTQIEAEIYAAEYNKKHKNKTLHGHQVTFSELYYRWLPFHIDKYLICKQNGTSYNYSTYCTIWNKVMTLIKAKHTTHDCRHTCATLMDNAEVNFNAKRKILGHSGGDVTDTVYTHKNLKQLRKAINKIK